MPRNMLERFRAPSFRTVGVAVTTLLFSGGLAALPAVADESDIVSSTTQAMQPALEIATDQFIVGLREDNAGAQAAETAGNAVSQAATKLGVLATNLRESATGGHIVKLDEALPADEAEVFLDALRSDPAVEYAEPDAIMQTAADPNDGLYSLQWDLWEDFAGLRAPGAWEYNRGQGVVVAVVDTGITSHFELDGNVLPGYDMISSSQAARDGDGRDADPTDEGDWISANQCYWGSPQGVSSWHGTHVAGTVAAISGNGKGVTGVAPEAKILPLRALGACGGYTSDIADSIVWAAGGVVSGAPINPNPARVINLSLGGISPCSASYQNAINFAYNSGAAVVVAAGNSNRPAADSSPANCQNVITVAASGRNGARAPYSNYGSAVDVTAPGGDMSSDVLGGILSTSNFGSTTQEEPAYAFQQGTSMAAPHVAGVAALLFSELGGLTNPEAVEQRMKETSRPLPGGCLAGCGSGLVDATEALDFHPTELPPGDVAVTPAPVTFIDEDGSSADAYEIPDSEGVHYSVDSKVLAAGPYPGSGTVSVLAEATTGFVLAEGATSRWEYTFEDRTEPLDVSAPSLVSSSVSPTSFDLSDGPAVVTVSVRLTDQTGANAPVVTMGHDGSGQSYGFGSMSLVSGDTRDGVWERTMTIPQGSALGQWDVTLYPLRDVLGNSGGGFKTLAVLDVSGAAADVSAPSLVSSSVSPTSFDLSDGPAVVTVSVRLTDQTGANAPVVTMGHDGSGQSYGFGSMSLVSGDTRDGVWERTMTIPQGSALGQWDVTLYPLRDVLGNSGGGFKTLAVLDVSGAAADVSAPSLVSSSVSPTSFDLSDGPAVVTVSVRLTDQTGANAPVVTMGHPGSGQSYGFGSMSLVSGDTRDGVWERTMTIPQGSALGQWDVTLYPLRDVLGNSGGGFKTVAVLELTEGSAPTPVTPAPVTFTDVDGTKDDTYTIPATEGVEYLVGGNVVAAGTYPGSGTVTVTAKAVTDYVLAEGATSEWAHEFKATPLVVTPAPVTFTDVDGTKDDTYTIPATEGVEYLVGGNVVAAGKYPGSGTVTVTAKAVTDYVLAEGATSEWAHEFKATPFVVTPAPVTFTDVDGTKDDTYTIPATEGVEYLVGGNVVAAGTYPGSGTVTVTAKAVTDYVLAEGAVSEWAHEFKATPFVVTPAPVTFTDVDGTKDDTYTIPATEGVEYLVGGNVVAAGKYPGSGTVTVTAKALTDYVLAEGAVSEWAHEFKATPFVVTPAPVTFTDVDGTKDDTYTIPATEGVEYLVGGNVVAAGTYPGSGTVTITARAMTDYVLAEGTVTEWSQLFKTTPAPVVFADLPVGAQFFDEISWLAARGISTGWTEADGSKSFRPVQAVNRDAMAAFMYRLAGSPAFNAPAVSPFADITPSTQFYKEITWLASQGISTGWIEANGSKTFRPVQPVNRDAMAAFMYRFAGKPAFVDSQVFVDVPPGAQFHAEISWLSGAGISTGWTAADGSKTFQPLVPVNRDAMAAFMYRYHQKYMNN
ncbi:S8 family serine peptidase [Paenarthrobacter aurescens]